MPPETLYICPVCNTPNFTKRGLTAHRCKLLNGETIGPVNLTAAFNQPLPMPKAPTSQPPAPTVPDAHADLHTGLPAATLAALKQAGAAVTNDQIKAALVATEQGKANYLAKAIYLGILCVAKRSSMKHGQFLPWLKTTASQIGNTVANLNPSSPQFGSVRTLRLYISLAESYLEIAILGRAVHPKLAATTTELWDPAVSRDTVAAASSLKLSLAEALLPEHREQILESLRLWVGPRSLRGLIQDLNRADTAITKEESEEGQGPTPRVTATRTLYQTEMDFTSQARAFTEQTLRWRDIAQDNGPDAVAFWANPEAAAQLLAQQLAAMEDTAAVIRKKLSTLGPIAATPAPDSPYGTHRLLPAGQ